MKKEKGIARCGLACFLCAQNDTCAGCGVGDCKDKDWCENRRCSMERGLEGCYQCDDARCAKGMLGKLKPHAFTSFARTHGLEALMDCLERNEKNGAVYHRQGIIGDYDDFETEEALLLFLETGRKA